MDTIAYMQRNRCDYGPWSTFDLATRIDVPESRIRELINKGVLPSIRIGNPRYGRLAIPREAVAAWLSAGCPGLGIDPIPDLEVRREAKTIDFALRFGVGVY